METPTHIDALAGNGVVEAVPKLVSKRVRSLDELSETVRDASCITSYQQHDRAWRLPSATWLAQLIQNDLVMLEDLPYLLDKERAAEQEPKLRERLAASRRALEAIPDKPNEIACLLGRWKGSDEFSPNDMVLKASGFSSIASIQKLLAQYGQCLPLAGLDDSRFLRGGTISRLGTAISFNFPHALEAQCGSWRDWVLGMTIVLADGRIVKSGSHAVKNVAGYDVHKLPIGSRGTLGIIAEVVLRTYPIRALPKVEVQKNYEWKGMTESAYLLGKPRWIQRTKASDFAAAVRSAGGKLLEADWASSSLCAHVEPEEELDRFEGDWVLRSRCGEKNLQITDPTQIRLMKRAKEIFDPTNKLNPGEMGIF